MTVPAFLLAGTHSGCGKTTLCAGLLRAYRNRGLTIAPFKTGPDYLDPKLHAAASGRPGWNLDAFFLDDEGLRDAYARGSENATLALVEGVMGLFDGSDPVTFKGSGADLARRLGIPIVLVVDGGGAGASIAATVLGHLQLWPGLELAGVILNRLSGERHFELQKASIERHTPVKVLGYVPKRKDWVLPERHLGIYQPHEVPDLDRALDTLAAGLEQTLDLDELQALAKSPSEKTPIFAPQKAQGNLKVALAKDEVCNFIYADTLDRLERLGVSWATFSPLRDRLPEGVCGLYLPGGYPELHGETLSKNQAFFSDLRAAHASGLPIFAECGGYMLLGESLRDGQGVVHAMAGVVAGRFCMTERLQSFGYKHLQALSDNLFCRAGEEGKAHEFHHSIREDELENPAWKATDLHGRESFEGVASGNLLAAYAHLHFGAQSAWAERWVARMQAFADLQ